MYAVFYYRILEGTLEGTFYVLVRFKIKIKLRVKPSKVLITGRFILISF